VTRIRLIYHYSYLPSYSFTSCFAYPSTYSGFKHQLISSLLTSLMMTIQHPSLSSLTIMPSCHLLHSSYFDHHHNLSIQLNSKQAVSHRKWAQTMFIQVVIWALDKFLCFSFCVYLLTKQLFESLCHSGSLRRSHHIT
jgi:hypothetical protein